MPTLEEFEKLCTHKAGSIYSCAEVTQEDIIVSRQKFFHCPHKIKQDQKISHMLYLENPKRRRSKGGDKQNGPHKFEVQYKIWCEGERKRVCKKFFVAVFPISNKRLWNIANKIKAGTDVKETRGGDRKSKKSETKRSEVIKFINSLKATESHYDRKKSKRLYLPSHLSIAKLWRTYNECTDKDKNVKYTFFSRIFNNAFNIGFGTPATDVCSLCSRLKNQIKSSEVETVKQKYITEMRVHKLRAKQFNGIMKETPDKTFSICFDMQQVQPLPKIPIQEAFYSHQISFYNVCFVDLQNMHPCFYVWTEDQAKRGALEVGSALLDYLRKVNNYPKDCKTLRLFSDGCAGQNKNCHIIHLLSYWLYNEAPETLDTILLVFPVRGHSYLPADRVFGRVEKELRKKSTILNKEDYEKVYEKHGTVRKCGEDYKLYNIKALTKNMKKMDGIASMKRIFLRKTGKNVKSIQFKMEPCFRNNDLSKTYAPVLKREKKMNTCTLNEIESRQEIPPQKIKTLMPLLSAFNERWTELEEYSYYQKLLCNRDISNNAAELENQEEDEEKEVCECISEDCGMLI